MFILGIVGAAAKVISLIKDSLSDTFKFIRKLEAVLYAAEMVFFILGKINHLSIDCNNNNVIGSHWVFSAFEPNCKKGFIDYCDKTTYHLAFWILIVYYTLLTIITLMFIIFITTSWLLSVIKTNKS